MSDRTAKVISEDTHWDIAHEILAQYVFVHTTATLCVN